MSNKSSILLAVLCLAGTAGMAHAAPGAQSEAYPGAMAGDGAVQGAGLRYQPGAFFYGNDCGGNSQAVSAARQRRVFPAGGVILAGMAGHAIAAALNCDDRRQALTSYRDAFEGQTGQAYGWRNSNGGSAGSITPVRQYSRGN